MSRDAGQRRHDYACTAVGVGFSDDSPDEYLTMVEQWRQAYACPMACGRLLTAIFLTLWMVSLYAPIADAASRTPRATRPDALQGHQKRPPAWFFLLHVPLLPLQGYQSGIPWATGTSTADREAGRAAMDSMDGVHNLTRINRTGKPQVIPASDGRLTIRVWPHTPHHKEGWRACHAVSCS